MPIKHKLTLALVTMFVLAFALAFFVQVTDYHFFVHPPFKKIEKGMPEAELTRLLGPPPARHEITDPYDISYKINGYTFRAFKATGTIYVYRGGKSVCYILLRDGQVVDFFIGYK